MLEISENRTKTKRDSLKNSLKNVFCNCMHPKLLLDNRGLASWRSGYAADCKSVYRSSILLLASKHFKDLAATLKISQKRFHIRFHFSRFVFVLFRASCATCARAFCRAAPAYLTTDARLVWPVTAIINSSDNPRAASSDAVVWRKA